MRKIKIARLDPPEWRSRGNWRNSTRVDFSKAIRSNRYANLRGAFKPTVFVDPAIFAHFGSEARINEPLRLLVELAQNDRLDRPVVDAAQQTHADLQLPKAQTVATRRLLANRNCVRRVPGHFTVIELFRHGVSARVARELAGHTDLSSTWRYSGMIGSDLSAAKFGPASLCEAGSV